jgi:hypothetical protein
VELTHPDIYPHQPRAGVEERVARETQPGHVVVRCPVLIRDAHVDVAEIDDVAEVLCRAIILPVGHGVILGVLVCGRANLIASARRSQWRYGLSSTAHPP